MKLSILLGLLIVSLPGLASEKYFIMATDRTFLTRSTDFKNYAEIKVKVSRGKTLPLARSSRLTVVEICEGMGFPSTKAKATFYEVRRAFEVDFSKSEPTMLKKAQAYYQIDCYK